MCELVEEVDTIRHGVRCVRELVLKQRKLDLKSAYLGCESPGSRLKEKFRLGVLPTTIGFVL
jgi:hypothetical protein